MIKILSIFLSSLLITSLLYAEENFSEMSTQELISIIGYVKKSDLQKFKNELQIRIKTMNEAEKKTYKKNLEKLEKS